MATPAHTTHSWRFGVFEVDAQRGEIHRAGTPIKLREQPFRILVLLLEHAGQLVTREELRSLLWPADTFVDFDHSLNVAVMKLREVLGDTAEKPLYIETIPRRGYRFIAPVQLLDPSKQTDDCISPVLIASRPSVADAVIGQSNRSLSARNRAASRLWLVIAVITLVATTVGIWIVRRSPPAPRITDYVQLTHDSRYKEVAAADASRGYVNIMDPDLVVQMPLGGGEFVPVPLDLPGNQRPIRGLAPGDNPFVYDLSPDGSKFLCRGPGYSLWSVTITGQPLRQLGLAETAAWSPDGEDIVYMWRGDVLVMRSDGTGSRLLVPSRALPGITHFNPDISWSPDGTRIRFVRDNEFWEVSSSGSNLHRLLPGWLPLSWKSHGHWTPDGGFFIFQSGDTNVSPIFAGKQLWALDERHRWFDTTIRQPILLMSGPTRWGQPIVSRDGNKIFARGVVLDGELVRFDRINQKWVPYLGGKSVEFVTFSPDRKSVAYVTFPDAVLYRANLDGTGPLKLTEAPLVAKSAQWSPDGSQILLDAQLPNDKTKIFVVPANGGLPKRLLPADYEPEVDSRWSTGGSKVVYSNLGDSWGSPQPVEIRVYDLAKRQVTSIRGSGEEFSPRPSPDGRYIAALTISEHKLKVFDLISNRWTMLYEGFANYPTWSADGRFIYFTGPEDARVMRVSVPDGKVQLVAPPLADMKPTGSYGGWFGLDPDDAPLFLRNKGTDEVYALTFKRE